MKVERQAPILVTGSAGRIGRAVVSALVADGWQARGFDRQPTPGTRDFVVADLTDFGAVQQAAAGAGAIIHLAAVPDDDDFLTQLVPNNLIGPYHVLEAARLAGVKRVVLASSGMVNWWQQYEGPWPVRVTDPITPRHWYSVTKVAVEAAGMCYARNCAMTVLAIRLGWVPRTRQHVAELAATAFGPDVYLSPGDAGRFFRRTIEAPLDAGFSLLFATSRPVRQAQLDLEPAKRLLDWEPTDRWPTGADEGLAD